MADLAILLRKDIDAAAHQAATSDLNLLRKPTEAQARAGNYRMGHAWVAGLDVTIENPAGSRRRAEWPPLAAHYGYVKGTEGADGDHVDLFVRPGTPDDWTGTIYVIDQIDPQGRFDEHKCMLGFDDERQATQTYLANFTPGWRLGPVTAMSLPTFKDWLRDADTTAPAARKIVALGLLRKEFTQSSSATSGITAYGNTGDGGRRKRRRALYLDAPPTVSLRGLLAKYSHDQARDDHGRWNGTGTDGRPSLHALFSDSLGLAREDMPQIPNELKPRFREELAQHGIASLNANVDARSIRPTQREFNPANVEYLRGQLAAGTYKDNPIVVSSDNRILDGHHRWAVEAQDGGRLDVVRVNLPIAELMTRAAAFNERQGITARSVTDRISRASLKMLKAQTTLAGSSAADFFKRYRADILALLRS